MAETSIWWWWRAALANPNEIGHGKLVMNGDDFFPGYYRRINKQAKRWEAVGIYPVGNVLVGKVDDRVIEGDLWQLWRSACKSPISFELYKQFMGTKTWPDEPPLLGDNNPPDGDEFEALRIEFIGEKEMAEEILKKGIATQEDADRASIWKDRFLKIRSKAQLLFKAEKQPIIEAGKAVDDKFRSLAHDRDGDTTAMIEKLRLGMEGFLKAQKRAEEERQRKAREAAEAAQRAADEAERQAREEAARIQREADDAASRVDVSDTEEAERIQREADAAKAKAMEEAKAAEQRAADAEREAQARKVQAGRTNAKTSLRTVKVAKIDDYGKVAAALIAMKDRAIIEVVEQRANAAAVKGFALDGMTIVENDVVR